MSQPTRDELLIKLDQIDTALEASDADKAAVMREAKQWLADNTPADSADTLYYRERLQVISTRHGIEG